MAVVCLHVYQIDHSCMYMRGLSSCAYHVYDLVSLRNIDYYRKARHGRTDGCMRAHVRGAEVEVCTQELRIIFMVGDVSAGIENLLI